MNHFNFKNYQNDPHLLSKFGRNLNELAKSNQIDPVVAREQEISQVIRILNRKTKNNPVLIGDAGVGKTAIVEGLAQKIVAGDCPSSMRDKVIYELDLTSLVAGAKFQGEFEERLKAILKLIKESNGKIILFIDELHLVVNSGKVQTGSFDIASLLKPALARREIVFIGTTTIEEYRRDIENNPALERRFRKVIVQEPSINKAVIILEGLREKFETFHGVKISNQALVAAVYLSKRYISNRFLPDKAIDVLDEACVAVKDIIETAPVIVQKVKEEIKELKLKKLFLKNFSPVTIEREKIKEVDRQLKIKEQEFSAHQKQ
jgi:ATP-dependent Clp protease ATP-binding subunit ClpB